MIYNNDERYRMYKKLYQDKERTVVLPPLISNLDELPVARFDNLGELLNYDELFADIPFVADKDNEVAAHKQWTRQSKAMVNETNPITLMGRTYWGVFVIVERLIEIPRTNSSYMQWDFRLTPLSMPLVLGKSAGSIDDHEHYLEMAKAST